MPFGYRPTTPPTPDVVAERLNREKGYVAIVRQPNGDLQVRDLFRDTENASSYDLTSWELGWSVRNAGDRYDDIDKRLAEAVYETQTFADYIGA